MISKLQTFWLPDGIPKWGNKDGENNDARNNKRPENWKKLEEKGTHVQRPLWASTRNKDPQYDDLIITDISLNRW